MTGLCYRDWAVLPCPDRAPATGPSNPDRPVRLCTRSAEMSQGA
jgi:hypothetical protein